VCLCFTFYEMGDAGFQQIMTSLGWIRVCGLIRLRHKRVRFLQHSRLVHNSPVVCVVDHHQKFLIFVLNRNLVNVGEGGRGNVGLSGERLDHFDVCEPKL
jgi:hypothetical protein